MSLQITFQRKLTKLLIEKFKFNLRPASRISTRESEPQGNKTDKHQMLRK